LPESAWQRDSEDESLSYGELWYRPVEWPRAYRYLLRREKKEVKGGQEALFEILSYSYYVVVTNRSEEAHQADPSSDWVDCIESDSGGSSDSAEDKG